MLIMRQSTKPCEDFGYTYYTNTLAFVHSKMATTL